MDGIRRREEAKIQRLHFLSTAVTAATINVHVLESYRDAGDRRRRRRLLAGAGDEHVGGGQLVVAPGDGGRGGAVPAPGSRLELIGHGDR